MKMRRPTRLQRGQAIVLVALSVIALTGMVALSIDVGNSFTQRRLFQTAADSAARAVDAVLKAQTYADGNVSPQLIASKLIRELAATLR